jgi:hypothetical protein
MVTALAVVLAGTAFVAALEAALRVHARRRGTGVEAPDFTRELRTLAPARYADTVFPHPYLGFVHHGNPPSGLVDVNNVGLLGPDFPVEKDPSRFTILLTGGSVALLFGQTFPDGPRFLEEELDRRFLAPDGRRFLVLNGGDGAWKQPQQAILFLLHAHVVDAVVTLDGWNERYMLRGGLGFEAPAASFHRTNPAATGSHRQVVGAWLAGAIAGAARRGVLGRSHAVRLGAEAARRAVTRALVGRGGGGRRTTVESLFALPPDWDRERTFAHAMQSYVRYVASMNAVAGLWGVRTAHFVQPVPAIDKPLTAAERAVVGDLGYADDYRRMTAHLLGLGRLGIPVVSLLDVFAGRTETIYADHVHCVRDERGDGLGYRLLAARMASELGRVWGLAPRAAAASAA